MSKLYKNVTLIDAPKALLSVNEAFFFYINFGGFDFNLFSSFSQEKFR